MFSFYELNCILDDHKKSVRKNKPVREALSPELIAKLKGKGGAAGGTQPAEVLPQTPAAAAPTPAAQPAKVTPQAGVETGGLESHPEFKSLSSVLSRLIDRGVKSGVLSQQDGSQKLQQIMQAAKDMAANGSVEDAIRHIDDSYSDVKDDLEWKERQKSKEGGFNNEKYQAHQAELRAQDAAAKAANPAATSAQDDQKARPGGGRDVNEKPNLVARKSKNQSPVPESRTDPRKQSYTADNLTDFNSMIGHDIAYRYFALESLKELGVKLPANIAKQAENKSIRPPEFIIVNKAEGRTNPKDGSEYEVVIEDRSKLQNVMNLTFDKFSRKSDDEEITSKRDFVERLEKSWKGTKNPRLKGVILRAITLEKHLHDADIVGKNNTIAGLASALAKKAGGGDDELSKQAVMYMIKQDQLAKYGLFKLGGELSDDMMKNAGLSVMVRPLSGRDDESGAVNRPSALGDGSAAWAKPMNKPMSQNVSQDIMAKLRAAMSGNKKVESVSMEDQWMALDEIMNEWGH